jgi:hypothetical protein
MDCRVKLGNDGRECGAIVPHRFDRNPEPALALVYTGHHLTAHMWFSLAAAHFPVSDTRRNTAVTSRDLVAKPMARNQIAETQKRAREWKWPGG